jgi:hypothetical protein
MRIASKLGKVSTVLKKTGYLLFIIPVIELVLGFSDLKTPAKLFSNYSLNLALAYFGIIYLMGFLLLYCHSQIEFVIKEIESMDEK